MPIQFCISETDAKEKACFMAAKFSGNQQIADGPGPHCIGSQCMAWRWVRTHINNPECPDGDLIASEDTHGYCGMAGPTR